MERPPERFTPEDVTAPQPRWTPLSAVATPPDPRSAACGPLRGVLAAFLSGRTGMMEACSGSSPRDPVEQASPAAVVSRA